MKKIIIGISIILLLATSSFAGFFGSVGLDIPLGVAYNIGYTWELTPLIDLGVEYFSGSVSHEEDIYADEEQTLKVDEADITLGGTRVGVLAKLNLPIASFKFHLGTQTVSLDVDSDLLNANYADLGSMEDFELGKDYTGTYFIVGLDWKIWVLNLEPYIGTAVYGSLGSYPCGGIRAGLAF